MLRRRLGSALLLMALITLLVFLVTASAGESDLDTLVIGVALALAGWLFRRSAPARPRPARRFRSLRRIMSRTPTEEAEDQQEWPEF